MTDCADPVAKRGMGEVWRARDPRLGRDVAIKMSAERFPDRFEREVRGWGSRNWSGQPRNLRRGNEPPHSGFQIEDRETAALPGLIPLEAYRAWQVA